MNTGHYTGIGSRDTPLDERRLMTEISSIPVFNLADPETEDVVRTMLRENRDSIQVITNRRERCERGVETFGVSLE